MDDSSREAWIHRETAALFDELEEAHFTEADCRRLATFEYDMDVDDSVGTLKPEQLLLQELLLMQGKDPVTAGVLARELPTLDWSKLEAGSKRASRLLGTTRNTLLNNMMGGRVPAKVVLLSSGRQEVITYWLSRIIFTRAWRRRYPWTGGPTSGFPPADYNATEKVRVKVSRGDAPAPATESV